MSSVVIYIHGQGGNADEALHYSAYFTMNALADQAIEKAYFISPVVDIEKLIKDMMTWANVDEIGSTLTIMKDGEHWFHTEEQMKFLDKWIEET